VVTLDFETEAIDGNPFVNPPKPVGLAIHSEAGTEYITDWADMEHHIHVALDQDEILGHNIQFDLAVAEKWFGATLPSWDKVHDTMYLTFLMDPHAEDLGLKPSAERYLGMPPDEQNAVKNWILTHVPGAKIKDWGKYICKAPPDLVGEYAKGDVIRTKRLYDALISRVPIAAYDRERRLAPILRESSRKGIRVDVARLASDLAAYRVALAQVDDRLRALTGCPDLNPGSSLQLAAALKSSGLIKEFKKTKTGRDSTSKKNLVEVCKDISLLNLLNYRGSLETCVGTFMEPWLTMAQADGRIHSEWNQVRGFETGKKRGTRTGRLSSNNPNLQNPPNDFTGILPIEDLPPLPVLRSYLLPEEGHVWLKRDFSSQEVRILAHYEDGALLDAYRENPSLDPHAYAQKEIARITGETYPRKYVKITAFTIIYGGGGKKIAQTLGLEEAEGHAIKAAYLQTFPGVQNLSNEVSYAGRSGQGIRTWGGRHYRPEPPKMIDGRYRDFNYKLLNYLIQGSAADQTKECLNQWYDAKSPETVFLATVHDEINASAPVEIAKREMATLKEAMDLPLFDSPSQSEGFAGESWANVRLVDDNFTWQEAK
jgi:DNA polymerase I-like protein with 3'-5' exonuclease and polymerase domains